MSRRSHLKRGLFYAFLGAILLILLLTLFRPVFLPDAYLLRLIERKITSSTSLQLSIESGRIRFLKGLDLRGVTAADSAGYWRLQVDKLTLRYRIPAIWEKKLVITQLQLDNPHVFASIEIPDTASAEPVPSDSTAAALELRPEFSLPISIEIARLSLRDLHLDLSLRSASGDFSASTGNIQIESQDIAVRKEGDLFANLTIRQDDSLRISGKSPNLQVSFTSPSDFSLRAVIAADSAEAVFQWGLSPALKLHSGNRSSFVEISMIESRARARLIGYRNIVLDSLTLRVEDWLSLQTCGKAPDILKTGAISANILFAELDFGKFQSLFQNLFPESAIDGGSAPQATGKLQIREASVTGSLRGTEPSLSIVIPWSISSLEYRNPAVGFQVHDGMVRSVLKARILPLDSLRLAAEAEFAFNHILMNADREKPIQLKNISGEFSAGILPGLIKPSFRLHWKANGPEQASQNGAIVLQANSLNLDDPAASPGFSANITARLERLDLKSLTAGDYSGSLDAEADIRLYPLRNLSVKLSAFPRDLSIPLEADTLRIPELRIHATLDGSLRDDLSGLNVQNADIEALPYGAISFHGSFDHRPGWDMQDIHARFDLSELTALLQTLSSVQGRAIRSAGAIHISGFARGRMTPDSLQWEQNLNVRGSELAVELPYDGITADSISLSFTASGENKNLNFAGETKIGRLFLRKVREEPLRNLEGGASGRFSESHQLRDALIWLESRELGLDAQAYVNAEFPPNRIAFDFETQLTISEKEPIHPLPELSLEGKCNASMEAHFTPDSTVNVNGLLRSENFTVGMADAFQAENLTIQLPYEQTFKITQEGVKIHFENSSPLALDDPVLFASMQHQFGPKNESGRVRLSSADFGGYQIQNLRGNLFFRQGRFAFPQFFLEAYGGTIYGGGRVDIPELSLDSVRYRLQFALESVNSSLLPGIRNSERREEAQITAFARFRGQGVRTDGYFDLEGGVDITHIGPRVADNLLKFLDPEETDPSIQAYRGYLSRGWGVKVFSFAISDDFVYASITPSQPPLSKPDMFLISRLVGLGRSITFGRVPLKFFLSNPNVKQP